MIWAVAALTVFGCLVCLMGVWLDHDRAALLMLGGVSFLFASASAVLEITIVSASEIARFSTALGAVMLGISGAGACQLSRRWGVVS